MKQQHVIAMGAALAGLAGLAACGPGHATADARSAQLDAPMVRQDAPAGRPDARPTDGATTTTTVVNGTVGGVGFSARDAAWASVSASGFDFDAMSTDVTVTNFINECTNQQNQTGTPNGAMVIFMLATTDVNGDSTPITAPGTYTVFSGTPPVSAKLAEVYWEIDDASCAKSSSDFAVSGTVTVTSAVDPVQATFDVVFPSDHITGSFHAMSCAALDPNTSPTC
jgi:hypothetical protein